MSKTLFLKSYRDEEALYIPKTLKLEPHHSMQFNTISRILNSFKYSKWLNSSIRLIDGILPDTTARVRVDLGAMSIEILHITQNSRIEASPWDCLVYDPRHSLEMGSNPSVEVRSAYTTAPSDRADLLRNNYTKIFVWTYIKHDFLTSRHKITRVELTWH